MNRIAHLLLAPTVRPFTIMAGTIIALGLIDRGSGYFFSVGTIFSVKLNPLRDGSNFGSRIGAIAKRDRHINLR